MTAELVALAEALPADRNPFAAYLARLSSGSRPAMRGALATVAGIIAPGVEPARLPWHRLRYQHTHALRAALAERFAPATANKHLSALRGVITEARRLGLLSADECAGACDVAPVRGARLLRGRALAASELRALFDHASERDAAALALLYGCGLRRAELAGLDLVDFDEARGELRVRGKGNKDRRAFVTGGAARALAAWLEVRGRDPGPLFTSADHRRKGAHARLTGQGVAVLVARVAERARVAALSPHDFRRSFVGDLLDAGADLAAVQRLAGHASPTTTARYDRRDDRAAKRATALLHVPFAG